MSGEAPRFSVVIPTHQRRDLVVSAVWALEAQDFRDFEVVVVVDGSTDGTEAALRRMSVSRPLRVLEQPNSGAAVARNEGARAARGELLLFLDDDMEADPRLLTVHERAHRAGADVVLGDLPPHPATPSNALTVGVSEWAVERRRRLAALPEIPLDELLTGQISLSHEAFEDVGGFDTAFTRQGMFGGEDIDFGYRLRLAGYRIVFDETAVSYQRFIVDPALYLRRARDAGRAAVELMAKHPERRPELIRQTRLPPGLRRYPMGALAVAPAAVSAPLRGAASALVRRGARGRLAHGLFYGLYRVERVRGARTAMRERSRARVLVLAYHAVADLSDDPVLWDYGVPPRRLAAQLDALARRGYAFVSLEDVITAFEGGTPLPARAALLTFDDAYAHLHGAALPLLAERGIPAVVFAVAGMLGGTNEWDRGLGARRLDLLDEAGLAELSAAGIEVGAHSVSHVLLPPLADAELEEEVRGAAERLESAGLPRPRAFSYPHGEHDARVVRAVADAGYALAFTVTPGIAERSADRLALPRVEVLNSDRGARFQLRVAAAGWPGFARRAAYRLLRRA